MKMVRKIFIGIMTVMILLLVSCTKKPAVDVFNSADEGSSEEESSTADSSTEESSSEEEPGTESEEQITSVCLTDPFTPQDHLADHAAEEFTLPAAEAEPLSVSFETMEEELEGYSTYEGGVSVEYTVVSLAEGSPLASHMEAYNNRTKEKAKLELEAGKERQAAYQARKEGEDYIYLRPRLSMIVERADTRILSYYSEVYRYNREYEPDHHEVHGVTVDAMTGRQITLNDILTDVSPLPDLIWQRIGRRWFEGSGEEEFKELVRQAIEGMRDDGSFSWTLTPAGMNFHIVESGIYDKKPVVYMSEVFVPAWALKDIAREGVFEIPYDHIEALGFDAVEDYLQIEEIPRTEDDWIYYPVLMGQKDGQTYMYGCHDAYTTVFRYEDGTLEKVGRTVGEIDVTPGNGSTTILDVDHLPLTCMVSLLQELQLVGEAHMGEDGLLVPDGLLTTQYNSMPIDTGAAFEAEIFDNVESTQSQMGEVPANSYLDLFRSDGETFVDAYMNGGEQVCRLYITGSEEEGWIINGHPMEEVIAHMGWWEE